MIKKFLFSSLAFLMVIMGCGFTYHGQNHNPNKENFYGAWYNGEGQTEDVNQTIYFDEYESTTEFISITCPSYNTITQENSCAPMAATIVIAYYDVTLTNLIPNFEPGYTYNGQFRFYPNSNTTLHLKEHLYDLMGTNESGAGTSVSQFKSGMTEYVNGQGYSIQYNSIGRNVSTARNYFQNQTPVVLFLNSFEYYTTAGVAIKDDYIAMHGIKSSSMHVVVAYGYQEFRFYQNNQLTRTDKYYIVSFGNGTYGYLLINNLNTINEAYAITIYW